MVVPIYKRPKPANPTQPVANSQSQSLIANILTTHHRETKHKMSLALDFPLISVNMIDIETMPCKRPRIEESAKTRVQFASFGHLEQIEPTISRLDMTEDEIFSCWWTSEEQETTRRQACVVMKRTMRNLDDKDFIAATIDHAYETASLAVYSSIEELTDESVTNLCSDEKIVDSEVLRMWTESCGPLHRGLERRLMTTERQSRSRSHRRNVLRSFLNSALIIQDDDDESSTCSRSAGITLRDDDAVAAISIQSSAVARLYARMVGHADSFIVLSDDCVAECKQ
jgi:hypothetical protein